MTQSLANTDTRPGSQPRKLVWLTLVDRGSWLLSPALVLVLWALVASRGTFSPQLLVSPGDVARAFDDLWHSGELLENLRFSLSRLGIGFVLGASSGVLFGVALALSRTVQAYCGPLFQTLRQIPTIALIPMFILLFGVEETFKVMIVTKAVFFPVALATSEGIKGVPNSYFDLARVYRLSWRSLVVDVVFPAAAPTIVTGLRVALTRAWMVLVASELLAADSGLGQMIEMGRQMMRIDVVMVGVIVIGAIGFALDYGLRLLEKHLFRWQNT